MPPLAGPRLEHLDASAPRGLLTIVDLSEVEDLPLDHAPVRTSVILNDAPVSVSLAVLDSLRVPQEHAAIVHALAYAAKTVGLHYSRF